MRIARVEDVWSLTTWKGTAHRGRLCSCPAMVLCSHVSAVLQGICEDGDLNGDKEEGVPEDSKLPASARPPVAFVDTLALVAPLEA